LQKKKKLRQGALVKIVTAPGKILAAQSIVRGGGRQEVGGWLNVGALGERGAGAADSESSNCSLTLTVSLDDPAPIQNLLGHKFARTLARLAHNHNNSNNKHNCLHSHSTLTHRQHIPLPATDHPPPTWKTALSVERPCARLCSAFPFSQGLPPSEKSIWKSMFRACWQSFRQLSKINSCR
jgi:hypothetical protein